VWIAAVAALVLVTTGCTASQEGPVEHVAEELQAALDQEDGAKACDLLSEDAQRELQESSGSSCEAAILDSGVSPAGQVKSVKVYGTAAQVRYDDTVFLGEFPEGWKVVAAGCEAQAAEPYDCDVKGG
jgi:hypothetical protein